MCFSLAGNLWRPEHFSFEQCKSRSEVNSHRERSDDRRFLQWILSSKGLTPSRWLIYFSVLVSHRRRVQFRSKIKHRLRLTYRHLIMDFVMNITFRSLNGIADNLNTPGRHQKDLVLYACRQILRAFETHFDV